MVSVLRDDPCVLRVGVCFPKTFKLIPILRKTLSISRYYSCVDSGSVIGVLTLFTLDDDYLDAIIKSEQCKHLFIIIKDEMIIDYQSKGTCTLNAACD